MSCNCSGGNVGGTGGNSSNCVHDIVRDIIRAQRRAVAAEEDTCFTGCDRSIEELLSPAAENRDRLRFNTIPFILYCAANCKPFVGAGVRRVRDSGGSSRTHFECVESPIFRAKSFVRGSENCVRLELLVPVGSGGGSTPKHEEQSNHRGSQSCCGNVCSFFPNRTRDFRATGICITVDLNHFTGISCLDPITPIAPRNLPEEV